jgi:Spy/CpxP family protein refolding chaperone
MSQQLNLTDDQRDKIRPILTHEVQRIKEIHGNASLTENEVRRRSQMVRKSSRQQIAQILTPDQRKQWHEMQQGHHAPSNNPEGNPDHPAGNNPSPPAAPPSEPSPKN